MGSAPPNTHFKLLICCYVQRLLDWKVYWKPTGHVCCVCGWQNAQANLLVQHSIKITSKSMAYGWLPSGFKHELTIARVVNGVGPVWMAEGENSLWLSQGSETMQLGHKWGLVVFCILVCL